MQGRTSFLRILITALATVWLLAAPAAAVLVSESMLIHNSDEMHRTATDLHFTFSMPEWENEFFWFTDYQVTTVPYLGPALFTPVYNSSNQVWKVHVDYYGIEVPFCNTIQVNITGYLNAWNVLVKEDIWWTFDTPPFEVPAVPSHMFMFPQEDQIEINPDDHLSSYTFINIDPIAPIHIGDLRFYRGDFWCDPADWSCMEGSAPIHIEPGFQTLLPGESLTIPLENLPNTPGYIYVAGIMEYQMPGMGYESMEFRDGHEEEIPEIPDQGCILPDNGTGTVHFPPECPEGYQGDMYMLDGLPPGTSIEIEAVWTDFYNVYREPGGSLGGERQIFPAFLEMQMTGTGELAGFNRSIIMPVDCETHTGPRDLGAPIQIFPTDLFYMIGMIFGDPDFDLLSVFAGTNAGLPSPGMTTLVEQPSGDFAVDSFFDITFEIEFEGAPGGPLEGMSGATIGSERFQAGQTATDAHEDDYVAAYRLGQCYPNPFNPETEIRFALPEAASVRLDVFTVEGRRVRSLLDVALGAGAHSVTFDGCDDTGRALSSGVYFYRLDAGEFTQTRSMTLLK